MTSAVLPQRQSSNRFFQPGILINRQKTQITLRCLSLGIVSQRPRQRLQKTHPNEAVSMLHQRAPW